MLGQSGIEYGKNRVLDVAITSDKTPYDEERAKVIECDPNAPAGSVFAYEVTEEETTVFTTHLFFFQESAPALLSRFVLSLPPGWEARGTIFNHPDFQPAVAANTYTWEMRDLPWIADEEYSPGYLALAPRLGITYFPASAAKPELVPFKDWHSVSNWQAPFADTAAEAAPAVRAKSEELTHAAGMEVDKIRAIAAFVQQTNYVAVDLNLMHGGGYIPRPAAQVLERNYGDCKDKAALMRALLRSAGIGSYEVLVHAGDRRFVQREWPSPMQFNHAIVAIQISRETNLPATLDHPQLGRLLLFDPTDPSTTVGDLPQFEQDSNMLIVAGAQGDLVKAPQLPPESNRVERVVRSEWKRNGISAHIQTQYYGQSGSAMRYATRQEGLDDFRKNLESSFSRRLGAVTLDKIAPADHAHEGWMELAIDLGVREFGQYLQGRMLVLRPGTLLPDPDYIFSNKDRQIPVELYSRVRQDKVTIPLPEGFAVDEMPQAVEFAGAYGSYRASWTTAAQSIVFEQSVEVKDALVNPTEYAKMKEFFDEVSGGQGAAVVLLKR